MRLQFTCVTTPSVPEETTRLLRSSCEDRGVDYVEVNAETFTYAPEQQLSPGDLLYRAAASLAAQRTEQFLFAPGLAPFPANQQALFHYCTNYLRLLHHC